MSILYNRILELCERKGITGYRLCKDLGVSPGVLTDLKMGRREGLSAKTASKIATYFGVSVGYLLGEEDNNDPDAEMNALLQELKDRPGRRILFDKTRNATPEQIQAIAQMIDLYMGNQSTD